MLQTTWTPHDMFHRRTIPLREQRVVSLNTSKNEDHLSGLIVYLAVVCRKIAITDVPLRVYDLLETFWKNEASKCSRELHAIRRESIGGEALQRHLLPLGHCHI